MKFYINCIFFLLNFSVCFCSPDHSNYVYLDEKTRGVSCSYITAGKEKSEAYVELEVSKGSIKGDSKGKVPYMILYYTEVMKIKDFPSVDTYLMGYGTDQREPMFDTLVNFDEGKFKVEPRFDEDTPDPSTYLTGALEVASGNNVRFNAMKSGVYCAYIAPEKGIESVHIPVKYKNSYGFSPYLSRVAEKVYRYGMSVGVTLGVIMIWFIVKNKIGKDFSNFDSISLIAKAVLFYVLAPLTILCVASEISAILQNNFVPSSSRSFFLRSFHNLCFFANFLMQNFSMFLTLMFSMGYGVIYFPKAVKFDMVFPREKSKTSYNVSIIMLVLNSVAILLGQFVSNPYSSMYGLEVLSIFTSSRAQKNVAFLQICLSAISFLSFIMQCYWIYLVRKSYLQTKKELSDRRENAQGEYKDELSKVSKAFKRSILVIFLFPIMSAVVFFIMMTLRMMSLPNVNNVHVPSSPFENDVYQSVVAAETINQIISSGSLVPSIDISYLCSYIQSFLLYTIWISRDVTLDIMESKDPEPIIMDQA